MRVADKPTRRKKNQKNIVVENKMRNSSMMVSNEYVSTFR